MKLDLREAGSRAFFGSLLRSAKLGWGGILNWIVPVVLAWLVTHAWHDHLYPRHFNKVVAEASGFGRVRFRIKLPGTRVGIREPLISCGRVGNASLVFVRLLPNNHAKVGVEFWGRELTQGPEFAVPPGEGEITLVCELPAFYPNEGDPGWGQTARADQIRHHRDFIIAVDGVVRLKGTTDYGQPMRSPLYFGVNPLGGSFVSDRFTGTILEADQRL